MIKLFGWESKLAAQLNEKRAEELESVRRSRFLGVFNSLCKYVACYVSASRRDPDYLLSSYLIPILVMLTTFATYVSCSLRFIDAPR